MKCVKDLEAAVESVDAALRALGTLEQRMLVYSAGSEAQRSAVVDARAVACAGRDNLLLAVAIMMEEFESELLTVSV